MYVTCEIQHLQSRASRSISSFLAGALSAIGHSFSMGFCPSQTCGFDAHAPKRLLYDPHLPSDL